jgi:predicted metalloprotease
VAPSRLRRSLAAFASTLVVAVMPMASSGCVQDEVERAKEKVEQRVAAFDRDLRDLRERARARIDRVLAELRKALPQATGTDPRVRTRGRTEPTTIDAFMGDVLDNIDRYWTVTLERSGNPAPRVGFSTIRPGGVAVSGCGLSAGDTAAFYCPSDDTIYVGQQFAADLYEGVARGLPGENAGYGRAAGDFAVAYVLAHEYAHNVQQELGIFNARRDPYAKPYELQADCLAGSWANSAYDQGILKQGDLDEILNTALAVGDFEEGIQHHGTPEERRAAVLVGFRSGDPGECSRYVPAV